jgi:RNA polymerase sigma factor (sigma-70 family)
MIHRIALPTPSDLVAADAELLERWRAGDQAAFAELVARYAGMVHASCRRQVGASDADDAAQAVFLVLAQRANAAARVPVLAAWLLRVARYACANLRRGRQRRERAEEGIAMAHRADEPGHDPVLLTRLDEAVDRLPEHERRVIVLHFFRGLDHAEAAAALGVAEGAVRTRLSRALSRLRDHLGRRGAPVGAAALAALLAQEAPGAELSADAASFTDGARDPLSVSARSRDVARATSRALRTPAAGLAIAIAVALGLAAVAWWVAAAETAGVPGASSAAVRPTRGADEVAAEVVDPASYLPDDPDMMLRLNDGRRTAERFAASPYARFLATASGRHLADQLASPRWRWLGTVTGLALGVKKRVPSRSGLLFDDCDLTLGWSLAAPDPAFDHELRTLLRLPALEATEWQDTVPSMDATHPDAATGLRLLRRGALYIGTNGAPATGSGLPVRQTPPPPQEPGADLEAVTRRKPHLADGIEATGCVTVTLTPDGLRSDLRLDQGPESLPGRIEAADLSLLRSLPGDTLAGVVRRCHHTDFVFPTRERADDQLAAQLVANGMSEPDARAKIAAERAQLRASTSGLLFSSVSLLQDAGSRLRAAGFPGRLVIDGDVLVYARAGSPFPSITISLPIGEADAKTVIASLATLSAGSVGDDGRCVGMVAGILPMQAGWADGALIVTTHPGGIAAHRERTPGFADKPTVAAALSSIPAGAYLAGVVDGREAWPLAARLAALTPVLPREIAVTLPEDLRGTFGDHPEYLYDTADAESRHAVGSGPVLGCIRFLVDLGSGTLPLAGLPN